jgi:hypothetical protein
MCHITNQKTIHQQTQFGAIDKLIPLHTIISFFLFFFKKKKKILSSLFISIDALRKRAIYMERLSSLTVGN